MVLLPPSADKLPVPRKLPRDTAGDGAPALPANKLPVPNPPLFVRLTCRFKMCNIIAAKGREQMTTIHNVSVTSRVLLYQDRDGTYVAHALETDLIGEGNSPNKAMTDLRNAMEAQITFAIQMGNAGMIQRQAPAEIITRWEKALSLIHI